MNSKLSIVLIGLLGSSLSVGAVENWKAKYTVKTVGEEGNPVAGVRILAGCGDGKRYQGNTDSNGEYVVESHNVRTREVGFFAGGAGDYYESHVAWTFMSASNSRCEPWNPVVTAIVRRVVSPIPMHVKRVDAIIPVLDHFVGYDVMLGDWVAPHGAGKVADLNFRMRKRVASFRDFDSSLELLMTNSVDGLQETSLSLTKTSNFRLLRQAPSEGYGITNMHWFNSSTNYIRYNDDQSFYFRIRSMTNESGQVTSALYGKVRGYFGFGVRSKDTGTIQFTYYLNPTPNDRNLEFDPKRNLFTNLGEFETVSEP